MPAKRRQPVREDIRPWGVFVFESHHAADFRMEFIRHAFLKVLYILGGSGRMVTEDGRTLSCRAGDVIVVPIGLTHRLEDDRSSPMSLYAVCVEPRVWAPDPTLAELLPVGRLPRNALVSSQVRTWLRRLLFEQSRDRPPCGAMIVGLTLQLLALLARAADAANLRELAQHGKVSGLRQRVEAYVDELARRFFEIGDIDQAAAELGMSRRRFTQLFREVTGSTWLAYVRQLRVDHARKLLAQTDRSVISIAFECGFEDLSSFYRAFGKLERLSPQRWRQRYGKARAASAAPA